MTTMLSRDSPANRSLTALSLHGFVALRHDLVRSVEQHQQAARGHEALYTALHVVGGKARRFFLDLLKHPVAWIDIWLHRWLQIAQLDNHRKESPVCGPPPH